MKTLKIFIVRFYYRSKADPSVTGNFYISSRSFFAGELYSGSPDVFGGLIGINGLGLKMGEVLPEDRSGSITISGVRGSYQFDKRFYDLTELNTFIEQDFIVYSFEKNPDILGSSSDVKVECQGKISNWSTNPQDQTTTFSVRTDIISLDNPHTFVSLASYPNAINAALGRYPFIFGTVQTGAFLLDSSITKFNVPFGYASCVGTTFPNGGIQTYNAKNVDNEYVEVKSAVSASSPTIYASNAGTYLLDLVGSDNSSGIAKSLMEQFTPTSMNVDQSGTRSRLVTAISMQFTNQTGGVRTYNSEITMKVYSGTKEFIPKPDRVLGTAVLVLTAEVFNPLAVKRFKVGFDKSFVVEHDQQYFISWEMRLTGASTASIQMCGQTGSPTINNNIFQRNAGNQLDDWVKAAVTSNFDWELYGATFTDVPGHSSNLSYFTVNQLSAVHSGSVPELINQEFIVNTQGIKDSSGGTISGSASLLLERADYAIKFLWYIMKGNSLSGFDGTTYSPGSYIGNIAGKTKPSQSYREIFAEILDNKAARMIPLRNGNTALWAWGVRQPIKQVFFEGNCKLDSIKALGEDAIINQIKIKYDKREIPLTITELSSSRDNYAKTLEVSNSQSISLYGVRSLSDDFVSLDYVTDSTGAQRWSDYKFYRLRLEQSTFNFSIPFWKSTYRELELMDIVELNHIDNPSDYGSFSSNQELPITTDGQAIDYDFSRGFLWRKAQSYKMRVLGKEPDLSVGEGEANLDLTLLVLNDESEITTYSEPLDPV